MRGVRSRWGTRRVAWIRSGYIPYLIAAMYWVSCTRSVPNRLRPCTPSGAVRSRHAFAQFVPSRPPVWCVYRCVCACGLGCTSERTIRCSATRRHVTNLSSVTAQLLVVCVTCSIALGSASCSSYVSCVALRCLSVIRAPSLPARVLGVSWVGLSLFRMGCRSRGGSPVT